MLCPDCGADARRCGRNRNGSQRHECRSCGKKLTDPTTRPVDRRCLDADKLTLCLRMILEGNSIRSIERLTGVHRDTIMHATVEAGEKCERFLSNAVRRVAVADVEADEIWSFCYCKERTRERLGYDESVGDAWCFTAIERTTKLILAWHLGKLSPEAAVEFALKLRQATNGRFQLSTDGFRPYRTAIPLVLDDRAD